MKTVTITRLTVDYTDLADEERRIRESLNVYNRHSWLAMFRVPGEVDIFHAFPMENRDFLGKGLLEGAR